MSYIQKRYHVEFDLVDESGDPESEILEVVKESLDMTGLLVDPDSVTVAPVGQEKDDASHS